MRAALAVLLLTMAIPPSTAGASDLLADSRAVGHLPHPLQANAVVWTGTQALSFGGYVTDSWQYVEAGHSESTTDEVFGIQTDGTTALLPTRLPSARGGSSAVWTGAVAYVFGGSPDRSHPTSEIVRIDPNAGTATVVARLPDGRDWTSAVWIPPSPACPSGCAFVFGGGRLGSGTDQIVRFDPGQALVTVQHAHLPNILWGSAAFWDNRATQDCPQGCAYIVGGTFADHSNSDAILRFDPVTQTIQRVATMPLAIADTAVVFDGSRAWILGGHRAHTYAELAQVLVFDPKGTTLDPACGILPHPLSYAGSAWMGHGAIVVGGATLPKGSVDEIALFQPGSSVRTALCAPDLLARLTQATPKPLPRALHVELDANVDVTFNAAVEGQAEAVVSIDPGLLATPLQGVDVRPDALPVYVQVTTPRGAGDVRLEIAAPEEMTRNGATPHVFIHDGAGWRDLSADGPGTFATSGGSVHVRSVGFDRTTRTAFVVADKLPAVAFAPTGSDIRVDAAPAPLPSLGVLAGLGFALALRPRR